ncbi:phosphatase PAP2 family protein [Kitasatospora sp. RB6PN24]|uniref:bifunctional phosphatase PAP2/diacylglycerol kinase family protein n=1 Tax=Kitasatospora humi TaxID=2893891 RepID=UPI001E400530|nr:bifunctional phosphatase PAP2/diacylglycerol kinase family protein [Kitasatospora humi]MCC9309586.1 phosphatase PAP2 family protein [Kitasatospora humi]
MRNTLNDLDARLFVQVASRRLRGADPWLSRLTRAADHGKLWLAGAAVAGATGNRTARRAALRATGSLLLASAVANIAAKSLTRRSRPALEPVPLVRRLLRQPVTSSFPSGHSASAAAFATGLAIESPLLGAIAAPVALGVMASRVYVGVHYPGDVLAGAALGAGAAALTLRWWPRRGEHPAQTAPPGIDVPALPTGAGLHLVVNGASGSGTLPGTGDRERLVEELRTELPDAHILMCGDGDDLAALVERAAALAVRTHGALGICGGDGSVNLAATVAAREGLPLAVFPGGTLNHFALDLGTHTVRATAEAVKQGRACAVDLGLVTGEGADRPFLNTFSVGIYPELVRVRERLEKRIGKWPALGVALVRVLATAEPVRLTVSGVPRTVWMLFAGNGTYDPPGFAPVHRTSLDDGLLDVRAVDGSHPFARTRLLFAFLTGTLARTPVYREARLTALDLTDLRDARHLAVDGETIRAVPRLRLAKVPAGLTVYRPEEPAVPPQPVVRKGLLGGVVFQDGRPPVSRADAGGQGRKTSIRGRAAGCHPPVRG